MAGIKKEEKKGFSRRWWAEVDTPFTRVLWRVKLEVRVCVVTIVTF